MAALPACAEQSGPASIATSTLASLCGHIERTVTQRRAKSFGCGPPSAASRLPPSGLAGPLRSTWDQSRWTKACGMATRPSRVDARHVPFASKQRPSGGPSLDSRRRISLSGITFFLRPLTHVESERSGQLNHCWVPAAGSPSREEESARQ